MRKLDTEAGSAPSSNEGAEALATPVMNDLLLGVTHHISNRVATLAGVSDLLAGDPSVPPILRALADEVPKLEEGVRLLRLLATPAEEAAEPLELPRVLDDAYALAVLHPIGRDVEQGELNRGAVPPVVARPVALLHELVTAIVSSVSDGSSVHPRIEVLDDVVIVSIGGHHIRVPRLGTFKVR